MISLITRFLGIVLTLLLIAQYVPGVTVDGFYTAVIVAVILGLLNITIRPILFVLTLPITLITFGLFAIVLNGILFWFVASFVEGFVVDGFVPAIIGALALSIVGWVLNKLTK